MDGAVIYSEPLPITPPSNASDSFSSSSTATLVEAPDYPHKTKFETRGMVMQVESPHLELDFSGPKAGYGIPLYSTKDSVNGTIFLDPNVCVPTGTARVKIALEGAFLWSSVASSTGRESPKSENGSLKTKNKDRKHVFLYSSVDIPIASSSNAPITKEHTSRVFQELKRRMSTKTDALHRRTRSSPAITPKTQDTSNFIAKSFLFRTPFLSKGGQHMPPSFDLRQEAEEQWPMSELIKGGRVEYRLVAQWISGNGQVALTNKIEVPLVFEPGSVPKSFYATPPVQPRWVENAMEPPAGTKPFQMRVVLTLPIEIIVARDSREKSSEAPAEKVEYFIAFHTSDRASELSRSMASEAKLEIVTTCTYKFDPCSAAATVVNHGDGFSASLKWHEPPSQVLQERPFRATRRGSDKAKAGKESILPNFLLGEKEQTVELNREERFGFPHRPKEKPGAKSNPDSLWKGKLNMDWRMIPTMDIAGLTVQYNINAKVTFRGVSYTCTKPIRIVEPHTVRNAAELEARPTKPIEVDGLV